MYRCAKALELCCDPKRLASPPLRIEASLGVSVVEFILQSRVPESIADNTVAFWVQTSGKRVVVLITALDPPRPS